MSTQDRPAMRRTLSGKRIPVEMREVPVAGWRGILGETETVEIRPRFDGVPVHVKARRRAANKVARMSRRANRGQR